MRPNTLDHVALWVAGRDAMTDALLDALDIHVIEQTDRFTLLGHDARRGKLTLFDAEGPRERGALKHIALRVSSLDDDPGPLAAGESLDSGSSRRRRIRVRPGPRGAVLDRSRVDRA